MMLLAVDPSLTCCGWALFGVNKETLLGVGNLKPLPASFSLAERLEKLTVEICQLLDTIKLGSKDYLICESPTTMLDPSAAIKVEQVRCTFETAARERGINVPGRINPRSVHHEVMGLKGKQENRKNVKAMAVQTVKQLFTKPLERLDFDTSEKNLQKNQDIVDAILVGHLSLTKIKSAISSKQEINEYFESLQLKNRRSARAC